MSGLREIRRRIRSIENTAKVTKAMEMIAASKMRRSQMAVIAGRPYSEKIQYVINHLAAQLSGDPDTTHPLLDRRPVKHVQVLHITPDRGLCGGLHSSLNRRVGQFIVQQQTPVSVVCVGKKGRDFMVRYGQEVKAIFTNLGDRPIVADTTAISAMAVNEYTSGATDEVYLAYAQFVSPVVQTPIIRKLLPIEPAQLPASEKVGYLYEPDGPAVLEALLPRYVEMQVYHCILELIASEQSARMVAMRNATDSAKDMAGDLTLMLNKVRQESITNELLDLLSGSAARDG